VVARARYVVQRSALDVPDDQYADGKPASVCAAVFEVLGPAAATVSVDAYSDYADQMPGDIQSAQAWLRARGFARRDGDPAARIIIGRRDEIGWAVARAFAPWSIRLALYDVDGANLATLEDGGLHVTVELDRDGVASLQALIAPYFSVVALAEWSGPKPEFEEPTASPHRRLVRLRQR
jgi:hypothetical protein